MEDPARPIEVELGRSAGMLRRGHPSSTPSSEWGRLPPSGCQDLQVFYSFEGLLEPCRPMPPKWGNRAPTFVLVRSMPDPAQLISLCERR